LEEKEEEEDKREGRIVVILFLDRWGLKMFDDSFEVLIDWSMVIRVHTVQY